MKKHNRKITCWNCPAFDFQGMVDFRACGQGQSPDEGDEEVFNLGECKRRPEVGQIAPDFETFETCPQWETGPYGYQLKKMRVMILGMDGYLGWPLALKLANLGYEVSGIDNYSRRGWVKEKGSHTIVPITSMTRRLIKARKTLGLNFNFREFDILKRNRLRQFIEEVKPEAVVHYAENPSAPYSMVDDDHAVFVQTNNVMGTLRVLFALRDLAPSASLIKLGTMGEYGTPLTGRPIFEGLFPADAVLKWDDREWSLAGEMTPRDPASFYHVSKVQDTYNVFEACKYWWLRSYDVMQGVIYGVHTDEMTTDPELRTRFDVDEWFGTAINRFVAQAIVGIPISIYGSGGQSRGFLALRDAMQCMVRLINSPPKPGVYDVVNQISGVYNLMELAKKIRHIGQKEFKLPVKIQRLQNPRVEADQHPYEAVYDTLPERFGFKPEVTMDDEIYEMFKLMTRPEIKARIEEKTHVILPKTRWSGEKKEMRVIEIID
ncbi:MAG: NAD-dependent epimerase/dehydratase family protein [bacterium]|nr:NAD-dependent epimerase/dehydratase family protein [bacterium]